METLVDKKANKSCLSGVFFGANGCYIDIKRGYSTHGTVLYHITGESAVLMRTQ